MYLNDYQRDLLLYIQETPTKQVRVDKFSEEQQRELGPLVSVGTLDIFVDVEDQVMVSYYYIPQG